MEVMSVAVALMAALFGALLTYVLLAGRLRRQETEVVTAETRIRAESQADLARWQERVLGLGEELKRQDQSRAVRDEELSGLRHALNEARERLAGLTRELQSEREQSGEKLALLQDARGQLTQQFQVLAQEILEEKSKRFSEQNQSALGQLLEPLKSRLQEFQGKVETAYVSESKDRSALAEQVKHIDADIIQLDEANLPGHPEEWEWAASSLNRVLDAVKHDVRKYVKRERGKTLPAGFDQWDFTCRVGVSAAEAASRDLRDVARVVLVNP